MASGMWEGGGYLIATEVCDKLGGEALYACLEALNDAQSGQALLQSGNARAALPVLLKAEATFREIPEARLLVGICKADLAAAYGTLESYEMSAAEARDAISILAGVPQLVLSEASSRMSLAISLSLIGDRSRSRAEFDRAERLLLSTGGAGEYLTMLRTNRVAVEHASPTAGRSVPAGASEGLPMWSYAAILGALFLGLLYFLKDLF